jgi:ribosome biogenesis protein ERB1
MQEAPPCGETDSEDEAPVNTVGNIPIEWYDEFDHMGYDIHGEKIMRHAAHKDELEALIQRLDDASAPRIVHDYVHGVDVVLSEADGTLIKRLQRHRYSDPSMNPRVLPFHCTCAAAIACARGLFVSVCVLQVQSITSGGTC